jgi:hypothetical protein
MLQECLYSIQHTYTCNIVFNILHMFNLNTNMAGNFSTICGPQVFLQLRFYVRDVGNPNAIWTKHTSEKVDVEFNVTWQPIGTSGMKFHRLGAKYVLSSKFVALSAPNWRKVEPQLKEDLWTTLGMVCKTSY